MMDELAKLKSALKSAPPAQPDGQAMARALAAAEAEFAARSQETADEARPRKDRANWLANLIGRADMLTTFPSLRPWYYGGASLAAMTLAVLSSGVHQTGLDALSPFDSEQTSLGTEAERFEDVVVLTEPMPEILSLDTAPAPAPTVRGAMAPAAEGLAMNQQLSVTQAPAIRKRAAGAVACSTLAAGCEDGIAPRAVVGDFESRYAPEPPVILPIEPEARDRFEAPDENPVKRVAEAPVSTFSIDVDTASYAFVRRALNEGRLPPKQAVRVEEMVNYFAYDYAMPEGEHPFAVHPAIMPTPWNPDTQLLRIALQGEQIVAAEKPRANLVFLIDTSGSMQSPDKLDLVITSLRRLLDSLGPEDTVGIVTYAGSAGVALEPTRASDSRAILRALEGLHAGGSTAGAAGIEAAYDLARDAFVEGGVNRVILATDGDFNVGLTDLDQLTGYVERQRDSGVMLSVLGFGQGNYNDALMQRLAQNGNGQAAYIDTVAEARKVLVEDASSALYPIAKDVKIQVEFNPAEIAEYRLIGYETRALNREDFNNDRVDAGEIGAGHRVTALYEITPVGSAGQRVDALRYGKRAPEETGAGQAGIGQAGAELAFLKLRYKRPGEDSSILIERPITAAEVAEADGEARFAAAVAGFAQLLRGGRYLGEYGYDDVLEAAEAARGQDRWGYRAEFLTLVREARRAAE